MSDPPPIDDWPPIDDALLKLAVESGVALESLAGSTACIKFSSPHSLEEIAHRWRSALRDDAFAGAFAARIHGLDVHAIAEAIEARATDGGGISARGGSGTEASDDDEARPPRFADAEQAMLRRSSERGVGSAREVGAKKRGARADAATLRKMEALERGAQATAARLATARGALAELVGMNTTFVVSKRESVIGRSTEDLKVDIDLGAEGNASKISRQQAFLKLRWNGEFALRNVGRRPIWCNNVPLTTGQRCVLAPHTLVEVGGMRFLFMPNPTLIRAEAPIGM